LSIVDERWAVAGPRPPDAPTVPLPAEGLELDRDTHRSLRVAARNLTQEFAGMYDAETIEHFLVSHYARLAQHARITKFLPLLAERSVRDRLRNVGPRRATR
jgi:hypothetical protein